MHIPDGFLSGRVAATGGALAVGAIAWAVRHTRLHLPPRKIPLMGLSAAFVFAAMMLNFPVAGGTSGHLIGGVLCSVLLGPSAAVLVITSVLIVQCFLFADGGVTALGANVFNMAVICSVGGYYVYRSVFKLIPTARGRLVAVAFASWTATVAAAIACAGELTASGVAPWHTAFPAMAGIHMLIGIGEAIITTLVIFTISQSRPDLLEPLPRHDGTEPADSSPPRAYGEVLIYGSLIALGLAVFVSPFACPWPDGLDHAAEKLGFRDREVEKPFIASPVAGYQMKGVSSVNLATSIAGGIGAVIAFSLGLVMAKILVPNPRLVDGAHEKEPQTNTHERG